MASKITKIIANFDTQLASTINIGATTGSLKTPLTDKDGVTAPTGRYVMCFDLGTSKEEHLMFDLDGTTGAMTAIKNISRQGVETAGAKIQHRTGAKVSLTNFANLLYMSEVLRGQVALDGAFPLLYDIAPTFSQALQLVTKGYVDSGFIDLINAQDVNGIKTFLASPIVPTPTTDMQVANKKYVDDTAVKKTGNETINGVKTFGSSPLVPDATTGQQAVSFAQFVAAVISGGIKATTALFGLVRLSVAPVDGNDPIAVGTNDSRLPSADPDTLYKPLLGDALISKFSVTTSNVVLGTSEEPVRFNNTIYSENGDMNKGGLSTIINALGAGSVGGANTVNGSFYSKCQRFSTTAISTITQLQLKSRNNVYDFHAYAQIRKYSDNSVVATSNNFDYSSGTPLTTSTFTFNQSVYIPAGDYYVVFYVTSGNVASIDYWTTSQASGTDSYVCNTTTGNIGSILTGEDLALNLQISYQPIVIIQNSGVYNISALILSGTTSTKQFILRGTVSGDSLLYSSSTDGGSIVLSGTVKLVGGEYVRLMALYSASGATDVKIGSTLSIVKLS